MSARSPPPSPPPATAAFTPLALIYTPAHVFQQPIHRIHTERDVSRFRRAPSYAHLVSFLFRLNVAMFPRPAPSPSSPSSSSTSSRPTQTWPSSFPAPSHPTVPFSRTVRGLAALIAQLNGLMDEVPPDPGPRRFGNVSFRTWHARVESRMGALLEEHLPAAVLASPAASTEEEGPAVTAKEELAAYLRGAFGSPQRLDYGTGHELSFLAFLAALWRLRGFEANADTTADAEAEGDGMAERGIVLGVMDPAKGRDSYFHLIRRLIQRYTLEPAGSHGVWGLDDHAFLPYIFGSAQLCPAIGRTTSPLPTEGSLLRADGVAAVPAPAATTERAAVEAQRAHNMYFAAIGFINDVKRGPFWEHSPVLWDISGVKTGWAKINKGMLRMYEDEVLGKRPVVQHFVFGSVLPWADEEEEVWAEEVWAVLDPSNGKTAALSLVEGSSTSASALPPSLPSQSPQSPPSQHQGHSAGPMAGIAMSADGVPTTRAPWARPVGDGGGGGGRAGPGNPGTMMQPPTTMMPPTRAPWATSAAGARSAASTASTTNTMTTATKTAQESGRKA
ncbi:MAG: Serine/threonine-protein phosphatase 2A activator 1 [Phylliscum demangeonii]|nr:MAG: Serine/threonine-protein phosphatase 2A activator 1 [Phylliscum demangeonii]